MGQLAFVWGSGVETEVERGEGRVSLDVAEPTCLHLTPHEERIG